MSLARAARGTVEQPWKGASGARPLPHRSVKISPETESINGLYKTELGLDDLEIATLEWVDWFNHRRLEDPGRIPLGEFEANHCQQTRLRATMGALQLAASAWSTTREP